jgi:hypothetical protein
VGSASEEFLHFILFPFTKAVQTQTRDEIETAKKCETPPMAHDCSVCLKLLAAFKDPEHDYHANLGSIEDILNSECSSHIELIKDILDGNEEQEPSRSSIPEWKTDTSAAKRTLEIRRREGQQTIGISFASSDRRSTYLCTKSLVRQGHGAGVAIGLRKDVMEVDGMRNWKRDCAKYHSKCQTFAYQPIQEQGPEYLIDVQLECLADSKDGQGQYCHPYVALSYCWGDNSTWFKNNNGVHGRLFDQGALSEQNVKLPLTVRHAMALVSYLDERYLWVDALCIIQDDDYHRAHHISLMDKIYASSCLTIVAAEGDHAEYGLFGDKVSRVEVSRKIPLNQSVVMINGGHDKLVSPIGYNYDRLVEDNGTSYHSRGWTYQEYELSKRRLIFEASSVRWECEGDWWSEDVEGNSEPYARTESLARELQAPDLSQLNTIINQYNARQLRNADDAFPAFLGIQTTLSTAFPGGFFYGMPIMFFDIAMAWMPVESVTRRLPSGDDASFPPSWSWLGWRGTVKMTSVSENMELKLHTKTLHLIESVKWFALNPTSHTTIPITMEYYTGKTSPFTGEGALISGWEQKNYRFLSCETSSANFHPGKTLEDPRGESITHLGVCYSIRDASAGLWCGILRLNNVEDAKAFEAKDKVTLVAISRGYTPDEEPEHYLYGMEEWNVPERPRDGSLYHYYNVLWVEWRTYVDGKVIAERKGIGRVAKERWEASNPQPMTLVLG